MAHQALRCAEPAKPAAEQARPAVDLPKPAAKPAARPAAIPALAPGAAPGARAAPGAPRSCSQQPVTEHAMALAWGCLARQASLSRTHLAGHQLQCTPCSNQSASLTPHMQ